MSLFRRTRRVPAPLPPPSVLPPSAAFLAPSSTASPIPAPPPVPPGMSLAPPPALHQDEPADLTTRGPLAGELPVGILRFDQGSELRLDRSWVIGRDPVAPAGHRDAVPFALVDATRSVSKTHLALGPATGGAWVIDLHSTNGVSVETPGAAPQRLTPGQAVTVPYATKVTYGERSIVIQG
ncbi:FHA domain-containing protein [Nocardioides humilatus]|uniref:FHA domain-containing protein n=1 Tax=Nocardioides humilatus TaxID=2607660 RepID=A0A5B1LPQ6_9ACTN|nr:FHA domain-containing protein [Nocardioides humilatus]KAA1421547.1 FHA domain-containing protein [Nocardioides humilatus]